MFNKIILMGRLCNDPEPRTTQSGASVVIFRMAVDRRFQKQGEERKSDFFNVAAWEKTGEFVTQYFRKGAMILVEGEMQTRQYTDKNGSPATWHEVAADRVSFTGEKAASAMSTGAVPAPVPAAPPVAAAQNYVAPGYGANDDYPF